MKYHKWKNKDAWVASRKVGNTVCDCRGRHSKIVGIDHFGDMPRWATEWGMRLNQLALKYTTPEKADAIETRFLDFLWWLGFKNNTIDVDFELDDGWNCNGFGCCDEPQPDGSCHRNRQ